MTEAADCGKGELRTCVCRYSANFSRG